MTSEFNELLPVSSENDKVWMIIIGTRTQVIHWMNECYVRRIATDRAQFTPIIPAPFAPGKYMCILVR